MVGIRADKSPWRDDFGTPRALYDSLNKEFGFQLDVCASKNNAKCAAYFDIEQDGLSQDWSGKVCWMNPPYGKPIYRWLKKAWDESQMGATVVCLIPAKTDTSWWHEFVQFGEVRFIRGRLQFEGGRDRAHFPSAIVIFRPAKAVR